MIQSSETRFLYSVYPKLPIKKVIRDIPVLRVNKSLYLTKEEVLGCLKCGMVQRRFANENKVEKVTPSTLDRLHNAKFMTEEEYEKYKKSLISDNRGGVINAAPVIEETVVEPEVVAEEAVEETVEEVTTEEAVEVIEESTEEVIVEEPEVVAEEAVEETVEEVKHENKQSGFQYNNKSKNKRH